MLTGLAQVVSLWKMPAPGQKNTKVTEKLRKATSFWIERLNYSIRYRGVTGTIQKALSFSLDSPQAAFFDWYHRVDTRTYVPVGAEATESRAVPVRGFLKAIRSLGLDWAVGWSLVDIGCGQGRALLLARKFPFRRVIGIELNQELARSARSNCTGLPTIEIIEADATTYPFPAAPLVIFMNNPFWGAKPMLRFCDNLSEYLKSGNPCRVVYWNPFEPLACPGLRLQYSRGDLQIFSANDIRPSLPSQPQ